MTGRIFLDTNLWIYLYAKAPPEKYQKVEEIINKNSQSIQISTQVLDEIFHVLTRKKFTSKADAITIISDILSPALRWQGLLKEVVLAIALSAFYIGFVETIRSKLARA